MTLARREFPVEGKAFPSVNPGNGTDRLSSTTVSRVSNPRITPIQPKNSKKQAVQVAIRGVSFDVK